MAGASAVEAYGLMIQIATRVALEVGLHHRRAQKIVARTNRRVDACQWLRTNHCREAVGSAAAGTIGASAHRNVLGIQ
jgi:hypothetical protein